MMYVIRINNGQSTELFSDPRVEDLAIINPVIHLEVNKTGTFTATIPHSHPLYDEIINRRTIVQVLRDDESQPIFQGVCVSSEINFYGQKKIECEGELTYLNDSILRPHKYQGETTISLLTAYINEHNLQVEGRKRFKVGNVEIYEQNLYRFTNYNSTMDEIREDLLDNFGGYISVRYEDNRKYIDYSKEPTVTHEQVIRLGVNLLDYTSNLDSMDIATRVIPLGERLDEEEQEIPELDERLTIESVNDGKDYLDADSSVIGQFGYITKVVVFDDVTDANILKRKGQEWLKTNQFENVSIVAKAIDLGYIEDVSKFRLMDRVRIISQFHGMDKTFMLTEMELNLNEPDKDVFTFGITEKKSIAALTYGMKYLSSYNTLRR